MFTQADLIDMMAGRRRGLISSVMRGILRCIEPVYTHIAQQRNHRYDNGRLPVHVLPRPVISIGNITTGGTGKTPLVMWLTQYLLKQQHQPAILTRGYASGEAGSDEVHEMRQAMGERVVIGVGGDRFQIGQVLLDTNTSLDVFVLDDGFQHRRLKRDLDIVLIDATEPFGFDHVLPRGLLREPKSSLQRADAVIVTRWDQIDDHEREALTYALVQYHGKEPIAHVSQIWTGFTHAEAENPLNCETLKGCKVGVVLGIGNAQAFIHTLQGCGCDIVYQRILADHFKYGESDLSSFFSEASVRGVEILVTSEKDFVKWEPCLHKLNCTIPIYRPSLELNWHDGEQNVITMVNELFAK